MDAPSFETLLNIEDAVNSASYCMISASVENVYRPRESDIKSTPCVDVMFAVTQPLNHLHPVTNSGGSVVAYYKDCYRGSLTLYVATEKVTNVDYHQDYVDAISTAFIDSWNFNEYLTYHTMLDVRPLSENTITDDGQNHEITSLQYELTVCIQPRYWPHQD